MASVRMTPLPDKYAPADLLHELTQQKD